MLSDEDEPLPQLPRKRKRNRVVLNDTEDSPVEHKDHTETTQTEATPTGNSAARKKSGETGTSKGVRTLDTWFQSATVKKSKSPRTDSTAHTQPRQHVSSDDFFSTAVARKSKKPTGPVTGGAAAATVLEDDTTPKPRTSIPLDDTGSSRKRHRPEAEPPPAPVVKDDVTSPTPFSVSRKRRKLPVSLEPKEEPQTPPTVKKTAGSTPRVKKGTPRQKVPQTDTNDMNGKSVVFTGVFSAYSRESIEDKAKCAGLFVRSAVSGKTDFLVHGYELEDGRPYTDGSKYKKAMEILEGKAKGQIRICSEDEFGSMLALASPAEPVKVEEKPRTPKSEAIPCVEAADSTLLKNELWFEKYRPRRLEELVGNDVNVRKLTEWLQDWHSVVIKGRLKPVPKPRFVPGGRFPEAERINARGCLISGPPGIGKTTTARVVATSLGFEVREYNASDDRGKNIIEVLSDMTSGGQNLDSMLHKRTRKADSWEKVCVIFDEIDGLSASDRGGGAAMAKLIDVTKCPVICICNDRTTTKVKTIASRCLDLRFGRPMKSQIAKRMAAIASKEGFQVEQNALEYLCESVGNDIRQMMNTLQFMGKDATIRDGGTITFLAMKGEMYHGQKDQQIMQTPFDAAKILLTKSESSRYSINDKMDLFFVDSDLVPLLMQENFIQSCTGSGGGWGGVSKPKPGLSHKQATEQLAKIARTSADFVTADCLHTAVYRRQNWQLMPDLALFSAIGPSVEIAQFVGRTGFPQFFGKNSSFTKNRRLLSEVMVNIATHTSGAPRVIRRSGYLDLAYSRCMKALLKEQDSKVAADLALTTMAELGLNRNLLIENLGNLRLKQQPNIYDNVDTSTKTMFTRLANKQAQQLDLSMVKKAGKLVPKEFGANEEDDKEQSGSEEESSAMPSPAAKSKGKSKAKSKARSKAKAKK